MRSRRSGAVRPGDAPPQPEFNGMPHVGASRFLFMAAHGGMGLVRYVMVAQPLRTSVSLCRFPRLVSAPGFRAWFPRLVSAAGFRGWFPPPFPARCFPLLFPAAVARGCFPARPSVSPRPFRFAARTARSPCSAVLRTAQKRAYPSNGYARMAVCGRSGITPRLPRTGPCQRRKAGKPNPREYLRMPCRGRCHLRGRRLQGHKSNRIRCNDTFSSFFDFLKGL